MKGPENEKICVSIAENNPEKCRKEISRYRFAELRGDFCKFTEADLEKILALHPKLTFTFRYTEKNKKDAIKQYITAINKGVSYIDADCNIPAKDLKLLKDTIAKKPEKTRSRLIISCHLEKTPSLEQMVEIVNKCNALGADIVKIIPTASSLEEASRVLRLYSSGISVPADRLVAFADGKAGTYTRISCLAFGAPFTYCCASTPTAEGQLSYEAMSKEVYGEKTDTRTGDMSESGLLSRLCDPNPIPMRNAKRRSVSIPCSKSLVQRAILAAVITNGQSVLRNIEPCEDIRAAIVFARKCGCVVRLTRDGKSSRGEKMLIIRSAGIDKWKYYQFAEAGESALLARLFLPISALSSYKRNQTTITSHASVTGSGSLASRTFTETVKALKTAGVKCKGTKSGTEEYLPIEISKCSFKKAFTISGKESSQLVSGFLMTLPLMEHNTTMVVEDAVSIPYIELTIRLLEAFGIIINMKKEKRKLIFSIDGNQTYRPVDMFMPSDWSGAANFLVGGAIASSISKSYGGHESFLVKKLTINSTQADEKILEVLRKCGVSISLENPERKEFAQVADNRFNTRRSFYQGLTDIDVNSKKLKAFSFDATDCPDLFPILATLAVCCNGTSRIKGTERLANKESNRALSILQEFTRMGYNIYLEGNTLVVEGNSGKTACQSKEIHCNSHNDHRIAMAVIISALTRKHLGNTPADIYINDISCIDKSFPTFMERLKFQV